MTKEGDRRTDQEPLGASLNEMAWRQVMERTKGGTAGVTNLFFIHGFNDCDQQILAVVKSTLNLLTEVTLGDLDIIFWSAVIRHEVKEAIVNVNLEG